MEYCAQITVCEWVWLFSCDVIVNQTMLYVFTEHKPQ